MKKISAEHEAKCKAALADILKNHHIANLSYRKIHALLPKEAFVAREIMESYLLDMNYNLSELIPAAKTCEIQKAYNSLGIYNLEIVAIRNLLPFKMDRLTVRRHLKDMGLYPFPDKNAFIKERIKEIRLQIPGIGNQLLMRTLASRQMKISAPTLAIRIVEIEEESAK